MKSIYTKDNTLVEQPEMESPNIEHHSIIRDMERIWLSANSEEMYYSKQKEYDEHLKSLRTLPCIEGSEDFFKVGEMYIEGTDYEVHTQPAEGWQPSYNNPDDPPTEVFAVPIKHDQDEKRFTLQEMIDAMRHAYHVAKDEDRNPSTGYQKIYFKEKFNIDITKKTV